MKEDIIIVGTGGHAAHLVDIIESEPDKYNLLGFTAIENDISSFLGYPILGDDGVLEYYYGKGVKKLIIGVGGFVDNSLRKKLYERLKSMGFYIEPLIHSSAIISKHSKISEGVVVFPMVYIGPGVEVGVNTIIAPSSTVAHGTKIGNHTLISSSVHIGGDVKIKDNIVLAIGSTVISGDITIENNITVGAGSTVLSNLIEEGTYIGTPAKKMNKK